MATEATSWISSYLTWLRDFVGSGFAIGACCRLDADGDFIDTSGNYSHVVYLIFRRCLNTVRGPTQSAFINWICIYTDKKHAYQCRHAYLLDGWIDECISIRLIDRYAFFSAYLYVRIWEYS